LGRLFSGLISFVLLAAVAVLIMVSWVYLTTERRFARPYDVPARQLNVTADPDARVRGAHVARIWGCFDCHGEDLAGGVVVDAPPMRLVAPNLTAGTGGIAARYGSQDWVRAIRHGVGQDLLPLLYMPSHEYWVLSDADLSALLGYVQSVPAVDAVQPLPLIRGLGRFLFATGRLDLVPAELIDHEAPRPRAPASGPTVEYGAYLASGCKGCHGPDLGGGLVGGAPLDWPPAANLTPDPETGLGPWSQDDFFRALREGTRPDGSAIDSVMPLRNTAEMTDLELSAIWAYLRSVPPVRTATPEGGP
jgi:mono/diheme cytochrome c family protein